MKKWHEYKSMDEAVDDYIEKMAAYGKSLNRTQARKEINKKIPLEDTYQDKIIKYLRSHPQCIKAWKESKGKYGSMNGTPDIIAVMNPGGVYLGIEVKRPLVGVVSDLQKKFIEDVNDAGGHACVAITVDDVKSYMRDHGWEV